MAQINRRQNTIEASLTDAAGGTIHLIIIQVASRALTFAGNQFVLRYLSPRLLGIAVQLELYSVSALYFSRESLRVALQRQLSTEDVSAPAKKQTRSSVRAHQTQIVVNLSYLAVGLGIPLTIALGLLYYKSQSSNSEICESPYFGLSLQIYTLASLVELLSEPCFVVIQERLLYKSRARSETYAAISKCIATCLLAYVASRRHLTPSVLPFAAGQIVYAIVLASGYLATVLPVKRQEGFALLPRTIERSTRYLCSRFYCPLVSLAGALYAQSVFKQVLTQGDALILGFLASLEDQGAFALASNYGGMMARLIFQPIEESSRNAFGKLLSSVTQNGKVDSHSLEAAVKQLSDMLHLYSIVAVLSYCFLYTVLPLLVKAIVGSNWFTPDIASILSTYCYYIPFMAYNGILDAFVTSVATPAELQQQSLWMGVFTAGYVAVAYFLLNVLELGARGLVLGNIFNMILRILWSTWFISRYVRQINATMYMIKDMLPGPGVLFVGIVAAGIMRKQNSAEQQGITGMLNALVVCAIGGSIMQVLRSLSFLKAVKLMISVDFFWSGTFSCSTSPLFFQNTSL
jgi:oligosaccharide translocation protein RFT1